jgi:AAA domain
MTNNSDALPARLEECLKLIDAPNYFTLAQFKELKQWLAYDGVNNKKNPIVVTSRSSLDWNNPENWTTFTKANALYGTCGMALGTVNGHEGFKLICFDFDRVRNPKTGDIDPTALKMIKMLNSFTEISMSGRGIHVYVVVKTTFTTRQFKLGDMKIEFFANKRFIAMTFNGLNGQLCEMSKFRIASRREVEVALNVAEEWQARNLDLEIKDAPPTLKLDSSVDRSQKSYSLAIKMVRDGQDYEEYQSACEDDDYLAAYASEKRGSELKIEHDWKRAGTHVKKQSLLEFDDLDALKKVACSNTSLTLQVLDHTSDDAYHKNEVHLVEDLIYIGQTGIAFGASSTGKTYIILDLCLRVLFGMPFHGRRTDLAAGGFIYIALEGSGSLIQRHEAWCTYHRIDPKSCKCLFLGGSFDMTKLSSELEMIREQIIGFERRFGIPLRFVVVDTLSQASGGESLNKDDVARPVINAAMQAIQGTDASFLFIGHPGKDATKGVYGSIMFKNNFDFRLLVEREKAATTGTITLDKQRSGRDQDSFEYHLKPVNLGHTNAYGKHVTDLVACEGPADDFPDLGTEPDEASQEAEEIFTTMRASAPLNHVMLLQELRKAKWRPSLRGGSRTRHIDKAIHRLKAQGRIHDTGRTYCLPKPLREPRGSKTSYNDDI